MYDFVHKHRRALQLVLALVIIPPFALFGVDSYLRGGGASAPVARVGDRDVTQQEFNVALRERQEVIQKMTGGRADPSMLDNAEIRMGVLDGVVNQHLLLRQAARSRMLVPDQHLQAVLAEAPGFQENGKFSMARYEQFLKSRGRTAVDFEDEVRRDLLIKQQDDAYAESHFIPRATLDRLLKLTEQQREVSQFVFTPDRHEAAVKLEPDAAKKYYDANQNEFRTPEMARVEYVVLTIDSLLPRTQVSEEEVKKAFEDSVAKTHTPETRQASHILIAVDAKAPADEKKKARAKAEDIHRQVMAKPASFADLAKKYSQDPGSAEKGGDLGSFRRGDMVKAFSDAAYQMKAGDISAPIETEYGYHIIKLTGVTASKAPAFEEHRARIETELKRQRAGKEFAALAESFNNVVFEQSENLKAAADLAKAPVQQSTWLARTRAEDARLNNPKLLQAIFSDEVLKNKRNSEAIEVAPGTVVSARLLEHKPAAVQPFDQVSAGIIKTLTRQRAVQLAAQEGRAALEKLRQGKGGDYKWSDSRLVSFTSDAKDMNPAVFKQVIKIDVSKLPAYSGVEDGQGGYALIRVTRVVEPEKTEPDKEKGLVNMLQQAIGAEQFAAYVGSLKQKTGVKIRQEALLDKKEK